MLGLFRMCTHINMRADLWWYKNYELIYSATLQQIEIKYKEY